VSQNEGEILTKQFYGKPGARNLNAKTNTQTVAVIRHLATLKDWPLRRLAAEFNLSVPTVHKIVRKQTWTTVDTTGELARLDRLFQILHGVDGGSEGAAESVRSTHPSLEESRQPYKPRERKFAHVSTAASQKVAQEYKLAEVMVEIGLDQIENLTDEMLLPLRGQIAKQQVLVDAYHQACPDKI